MASRSGLDDPALWTTSQLISNLCRNEISDWYGSGQNVPVPRASEVATAFIENDVDGDVFLHLDLEQLRQMSLTSIGQLNKLYRLIKFLRNRSEIYIAQNGRESSTVVSRSIEKTSSLQPDPPGGSSNIKSPEPSLISKDVTMTDQTVGLNGTSRTATPHLQDNDLMNHHSKRDHSILDMLSENVDAQQALNLRDVNVKNIVPSAESMPGNKRQGVGLEESAPKRKRLPWNTESPKPIDNKRRIQPTFLGNTDEFSNITEHQGLAGPMQTIAVQSERDARFDMKSDDDLGPYRHLLDKYPPRQDDEVLPLFGESDIGDVEITDDSTSPEPEKYDDIRKLRRAGIDQIIEEAVKDFQTQWKIRKLDSTHKRAYYQWMATANSPESRQKLIQDSIRNINHLQNRMSDLKKWMHASSWNRPEDVRRQCDCLQATVDQQEEYAYCKRILANNAEPPAPQRTTKAVVKQPRQRPSNDEILCESDSDDSLADFVSEDTQDDTSQEVLTENDAELLYEDESGSETSESSSADVNTLLEQFSSKSLKDAHSMVGLPSINSFVNGQSHEPNGVPRTPRKPRFTEEAAGDADDEDHEPPPPSSRRRSTAKSQAAIQGRIRNPLLLPARDSSDSESSTNIVISPSRARTRLQKPGKSFQEPIVLTSSPIHSDMDLDSTDHEIRTPELNPVDVKHEPGGGSGTRNVPIFIGQGSSRMIVPNIIEVMKMPWKVICTDPVAHDFALAKTISEMDHSDAQVLLQFIQARTLTDVEDVLQSGMQVFKSDSHIEIDVPENKKYVAMLLTLTFMSYVCVRKIDEDDISEMDCDLAGGFLITDCVRFHDLTEHLLRQHVNALRKLDFATISSAGDTTGDDTSLTNGTDLDSDGVTRLRKRPKDVRRSLIGKGKNKVKDATINTQRTAKKRVAEQEAQKKMISHKLASQAQPGDAVKIAINYKEPLILLDQHIATRIKAHQIQGVQFIWRELIVDKDLQGCLLAHTMGLGKTMQVISVLVTIAQCNRSSDPEIRNQIPDRLQNLRIMILSPPALCENWFDELMFWMPEHDTLGPIYKITNRTKQPYHEVRQWSESNGVLLLGYDRLVSYTKIPSKLAHETPGQYASKLSQAQNMSQWLLETPTIVVADEAHMLKNPTAKRAETAMRLRTTSRIALTGSPLSNHLEEYWAMINFAAPEYLCDLNKFKKKFVEPINRCLSSDSGRFDRRLGLKKMHVLRKMVDPKVNRADITAIQNDLPPKTEFFIVVPLTDIQLEMYKVCVDFFRGVSAELGLSKGKNASLWQWISVLSLLCNHPWTFQRKLTDPQRKTKARDAAARESEGYYDDDVGLQAHVADDIDFSDQPTMLQAMRLAQEAVTGLLQQNFMELKSPRLSNRTILVQAIIKESLDLGEKILIFSHSLLTLDYMELVLDELKCPFERIDGSVASDQRQRASKEFNAGLCEAQAFLISTRAGGLGLNLFGATRVVILDYSFNPSWEEQAIGRAYRLGQKKPVFVYRFRSGGTFEDQTFNQAIFKTQLFTRIIDHKAVLRKGSKNDAAKYLFDPFDPPTKDISECHGKDPLVMDKIMGQFQCIREIVLTETFAQDINEPLTEIEIQEADQEYQDETLARTDPEAYQRRQAVLASRIRPQPDPSQQQSPYFSPAERLYALLHGPPNASVSSAFEPFRVPSAPLQPIPGIRQSYDDSVVPDHSRPRSADGIADKHEKPEARQQGQEETQKMVPDNCPTQ